MKTPVVIHIVTVNSTILVSYFWQILAEYAVNINLSLVVL